MLDMGFLPDVERILRRTPRERQTALFSATVPTVIRILSRRYMFEPASVHVQPQQLTVNEVDQVYYEVADRDKVDGLMSLIEQDPPERAIDDRRLHPGWRGRPRRRRHAGRRRIRRGAGRRRLSSRAGVCRARWRRSVRRAARKRHAAADQQHRPGPASCRHRRAGRRHELARDGSGRRPDVPAGVLIDRGRSHERDADGSTACAGLATRRGCFGAVARLGHRPACRRRHARSRGDQHRTRVLS